MTADEFDQAVAALSEDEEFKLPCEFLSLSQSKISKAFREMQVAAVLEREPPNERLEINLTLLTDEEPRIFDALKKELGR